MTKIKKKKIMIIGHTGFIGQKLLERIKKKGDQVYLISQRLKNKNKNEFAYDIFANDKWFKYLTNCITVFFLAFNNNLYELEKKKNYINKIANFSYKFNEYLIKNKIKINLIFTSTATIYGTTNSNQIINEKFKDNPISVYDQSKLAFEKIFIRYAKYNYLNFVSLRLSNIYGNYSSKKQKNRGFLNKLIIKSVNGDIIDIFGNGYNKRSYVYIDDLIDALLLSQKKIKKINSKIFLICDNKSYSFNQVVKIISQHLKKKIKIKKIKYPKLVHKIEKRSFVGNYNYFKKKTGWSPKINFETGIKKIIKINLKTKNENYY